MDTRKQDAGRGAASGAPGRGDFASRRPARDATLHPPPAPDGGARLPPRLGDRATRAVLLVALLLQLWAWHRLSGYQLADSVEFMDRAFAVARGETLDSTGAVRSFGFSTLLLPFFALARALEVEELRRVVHAVRLFQMTLGLGLVFACMRLGWRLGGRRVGWLAGLFVAANPVFLQYSVDPVSGVAAACFTAFALDLLVERRPFAASLGGGLLLGAAFMMAYQTLLIAAPVIALILLRDRWRVRSAWGGAALGLALALLAQVALDKLTYGTWGVSITTYVVENAGGVVFTFLAFLGLGDAGWVRELYATYAAGVGEGAEMVTDGARRGLQSPLFYLLHLPEMLVWPALACLLLGIARATRERGWRSALLVALLALNVAVMSHKGSKSFRLWLPLLPLLAPLCAWGLAWLGGLGAARPARWRTALLGAAVLAIVALGLTTHDALNTRRFGAYWDAMEFVNARAAEHRAEAARRGEAFAAETVGAAYNWAVFCRGTGDVHVVKFEEHVDRWEKLTEEQRAEVLGQLAELDWLVVHGTILPLEESLTTAINANFEVLASFWTEDTEPSIRDVRVLRSLRGGPGWPAREPGRRARRLFEVVTGQDPDAWRAQQQLEDAVPQPPEFVGEGLDGRRERLTLLGFEIEELPGAGFHWITYHWTSATGFDRDYVLIDRITSLSCPWAWQHNRVPGHGALPTTRWAPGDIVREGYLLVLGERPFDPEGFHPLGGSYRRGELMPAMLWARGESPPPDVGAHLLRPVAPGSDTPLAVADAVVALEESGLRTPEGFLLSQDGLVRVAKLLLPVRPRYRWPDDGRPGPDDAVLERNQERERARQERRMARQNAEEVLGGAEDAGAPPADGDSE